MYESNTLKSVSTPPDEIDLPHLKMAVSDHAGNLFGVQWQRYWEHAPYPELVKNILHVVFEVDNIEEAIKGYNVIILQARG